MSDVQMAWEARAIKPLGAARRRATGRRMSKSNLSLGAVWEETVAFLKAELSLVAPLSLLGFGLPMVALLLAVPADSAITGKLQPGPWMFWVIPCLFVSMLGSLAVSALVLTPNISVRESIAIAIRRIPAGLGLAAFYVGLQVALSIPLALADLAEGGAGPISTLVYLAGVAFMIWVFVRVMPIWAVVAERPQSSWASVTRAFALTRFCYVRLLALRFVMLLAVVVTLIVLLIPIGAVTRLVGALSGNQNIGFVLSFVCMGIIVAGMVGTWTVFVALLYRRLEADNSGT
ncbi:hypothetical protein [Sphingomonas oryzagri]|nr:hypothetical protein [Sphingomonas oryzagri]